MIRKAIAIALIGLFGIKQRKSGLDCGVLRLISKCGSKSDKWVF